jgi:hypothetical protein
VHGRHGSAIAPIWIVLLPGGALGVCAWWPMFPAASCSIAGRPPLRLLIRSRQTPERGQSPFHNFGKGLSSQQQDQRDYGHLVPERNEFRIGSRFHFYFECREPLVCSVLRCCKSFVGSLFGRGKSRVHLILRCLKAFVRPLLGRGKPLVGSFFARLKPRVGCLLGRVKTRLQSSKGSVENGDRYQLSILYRQVDRLSDSDRLLHSKLLVADESIQNFRVHEGVTYWVLITTSCRNSKRSEIIFAVVFAQFIRLTQGSEKLAP